MNYIRKNTHNSSISDNKEYMNLELMMADKERVIREYKVKNLEKYKNGEEIPELHKIIRIKDYFVCKPNKKFSRSA